MSIDAEIWAAAEREMNTPRGIEYPTPGALAMVLDPTTKQTPALDLIDAAMVDVEAGRCDRLIISMPPQEGKSTRVTKVGPLWALIRNPDRRVVVVSYGSDLANEFGRDIRGYITNNQGVDGTLDLGLRIAPDNGAVSSWRIAGRRGGVRSIGLAGGITGRPADWLFIDDPVANRARAESEAYRAQAKDFWTSTGSTRLAPGAPVVLILCMTGDTPVLMADGTERALSDIRPGDQIATYEQGRLATSTVRNWANQGYDFIYEIRMKSGTTVRSNARHPFLTMVDGVETWQRTDMLRPGTAILRATGGSGGGSPAPPRGAKSPPSARACACPTTAEPDGRPGIVRRQSTPSLGEPLVSSTAMESTRTSTTGRPPSRAGVARSAASSPPSGTHVPTGTGNSVSTMTTPPAASAVCCATPATSRSDMARLPSASVLPLSTWSVTSDEVVEIVPAGMAEVFDLQVDRTENFIANGLVSHNTRWHEDDMAGWLLSREDGHRWRVINIPAQADHDPNKGQADPLGREPGEYMTSARVNPKTGSPRTFVEWEQIKVQAGSRDWQALYQGRPAPPEGGMFKRDWWQYYDGPQWFVRADGAHMAVSFDEVAESWDMTFKDTEGTDYVVGQVWGRRGMQMYLLDQVRRRMTFVETCQAVRTLSAKWPQASAKYVEDKANGTAVINQLRRTVGGLIPVEPDGSKVARAAAVSPFVEAGNIFLPDVAIAPWVEAFVEEHASFPAGAHDDQVDADTQAQNRMLLNPLLAGNLTFEDDTDDDFSISPY